MLDRETGDGFSYEDSNKNNNNNNENNKEEDKAGTFSADFPVTSTTRGQQRTCLSPCRCL